MNYKEFVDLLHTDIALSVVILILILFGLTILSSQFFGFEDRLKGLWRERESESPTDHALQGLLKAIPAKYTTNALIVIDEDGKVRSWNKGAELMFGYTEKDMYDKDLSIIIPERYRRAHLEGIKRFKDTNNSSVLGRPLFLEGKKKDGTEFPIEITIYVDKSITNVTYISAVIVDRSEYMDLQRKNSMILNSYVNYERIAKIGGWEWDLTTDHVNLTSGFAEIFELDITDIHTSEVLMKRIHIEDRKRVNDAIQTAYENRQPYETRYRIRKNNDKVVDILVRGEPVIDSSDNLCGFKGIVKVLN